MTSQVMTRSTVLPPIWKSVLAVVAHPDDRSFGLGAVLDAFITAGARVRVLCLTHGEAWSLHAAPGDLATLRGSGVASADDVLGATRAKLRVKPDGALSEVCQAKLANEVVAAAGVSHPEGLLVFDTAGLTGHLDDKAAAAAGLLAADSLNLPVLGWTLPEIVAAQLNREYGVSDIVHRDGDIDLRVTLDRARQRLASHTRTGKARPGSDLRRRVELLAETGSLRWLRPPGGALDDPAATPMRVEHRGGDKFDTTVRGHIITVDQPIKDGGADTAPTPTELFVASLASCVAFYARRYLTRHSLPTEGLAVEATFDMGSKPARVAGIDLRLILPEGVPAERRDPLLAVASHCTVHNTLATNPDVSITLVDV